MSMVVFDIWKVESTIHCVKIEEKYMYGHSGINGLIRRPLLARGIKAAGLGIIRILTISGHAFSCQAICCQLF